jgi:hypothetical protein
VARLFLQRHPSQAGELKRLALALADAHRRTLPLAAQALLKFAGRAQQLAFEAVVLPIKQQFELLPTMDCWALAPDEEGVPCFSVGPSAYISRAGEHLLAFLQQLDLFQGERLSHSNCTVTRDI